MTNELPITKKMGDVIVQVCFDVAEFKKHHDLDHPESAKNIFDCSGAVERGLQWFLSSKSKSEMLSSLAAYLNAVDAALQLYENVNIPIQNKEEILLRLKNLQSHLVELKKQLKLKG